MLKKCLFSQRNWLIAENISVIIKRESGDSL